MTVSPLRSFRFTCKEKDIPIVEDLLAAQGILSSPEPFFPFARRLLASPAALGSSVAAFFGLIYIQDRSSMLPPLVLSPQPGAAVLDMCASPGSKTSLLGHLVGESGFVLGNEPSKNRLATLRRNLQTQNMLCCATTSHSGESLPLPSASTGTDGGTETGWPFILLDPPCSGWGTVEKNPQVIRLWQGDKIAPLLSLQRALLAEAARLVRPGGRIVYSTCTTNTAENEEQLHYACNELGLRFVPAQAPDGFSFADAHMPDFAGALRVETGADGQGFFVALLEKPADDSAGAMPAPGNADEPAPSSGTQHDDASSDPGYFIRPWGKDSRFVGEHRRHEKKRRVPQPPVYLGRESIESLFTDPALLPPGEIAVFNDVAHFLPEHSRSLLPAGFSWKGFPLGRLAKNGALRTSAMLRALMPSLDEAVQRGLPVLVLEDIEPVLALQSGQSLAVDCAEAEMGLYFKDLPLCRLSVKGKRAVMPAG